MTIFFPDSLTKTHSTHHGQSQPEEDLHLCSRECNHRGSTLKVEELALAQQRSQVILLKELNLLNGGESQRNGATPTQHTTHSHDIQSVTEETFLLQ